MLLYAPIPKKGNLLTEHRSRHFNSYFDRLCFRQKLVGQGLNQLEIYFKTTIAGLVKYLKIANIRNLHLSLRVNMNNKYETLSIKQTMNIPKLPLMQQGKLSYYQKLPTWRLLNKNGDQNPCILSSQSNYINQPVMLVKLMDALKLVALKWR